jgi:truncated hemoglobin YjbI
MDEIIRAFRHCPSGALSYAIDGVEARGQVDHADTRSAEVEVSKNRPVSGMHWYVEFHDPVRDEERRPTIFEWVGGLPALTRMTRLFYEKHVPQDPLLAPLLAGMSPDHPERVAKWLAEVFCGPCFYSEEYSGYPRMLSQHLGRAITEERRRRWVALVAQSALEAGLPNDPEFRSVFASYIEWGSRLAVENSQIGATPPEHMRCRAGIGTLPQARLALASLPSQASTTKRRHSSFSRNQATRSASTPTSSRSFVSATAGRCSSLSTSGTRRTWQSTPTRS